jgi:hypothetical protein
MFSAGVEKEKRGSSATVRVRYDSNIIKWNNAESELGLRFLSQAEEKVRLGGRCRRLYSMFVGERDLFDYSRPQAKSEI